MQGVEVMRCPSCGFENPEGMNFCGKCATSLGPGCPNCGFKNPPGFEYCGKCATPILENKETIKDNARFFASENEVPRQALSMGNGSIIDAKEVVLIADKVSKADAIAKSIEGPATEDVPASLLQSHPNVTFIVDKDAASKLTKEYA